RKTYRRIRQSDPVILRAMECRRRMSTTICARTLDLPVFSCLRESGLRDKSCPRCGAPRSQEFWLDDSSACLRYDRNHVLSFDVVHQLRHALRMGRVDVAVGLKDQLPAITMTLPFADHLHVDSLLDRSCDEHPAQTAVRELREP